NRGDAVWFGDGAARDLAARERAQLNAALDVLPIPVWRRDANLQLTAANRAFAAAIGAGAEGPLRQLARGQGGHALAETAAKTGRASERRHIVVEGSRRWLELTEIRLGDSGELLGFARDLTEIEAAETELKRHVAAHAAVLERVAVAIAIYG